MAGISGSKSNPTVDVLVLNWNGRRTLRRCLDALHCQTYPAMHVTVIDNGSADGSLDLLRSAYSWAEVMYLPSNVGFGRAYNRAVQGSASGLVALLNNDAYPAPTWLAELVSTLQPDETIAACTSRILLAGTDLLNHAGGMLTYAGTGWDVGYGERASAAYVVPRDVGCFSGAAALLRKSAFLEASGFDENFFAYCEDADLSWTFWQMGYRVRYVPTAVVEHEYGATGGGRYAAFRLYHAQRNRLRSMLKHAALSELPAALVLSIGFDLFRIGAYALRGRWRLVRAILAGSAAAFRDLASTWRARRRQRKLITISNRELERLGALASAGDAIREYLRLERSADPTSLQPPVRSSR